MKAKAKIQKLRHPFNKSRETIKQAWHGLKERGDHMVEDFVARFDPQAHTLVCLFCPLLYHSRFVSFSYRSFFLCLSFLALNGGAGRLVETFWEENHELSAVRQREQLIRGGRVAMNKQVLLLYWIEGS